MQSSETAPRSKARAIALALLGIATVVGFAYFLQCDARMNAAGGPGIARFELVADRITAARIMAAWGPAGQQAAKDSLHFDFLYLVIYGAFFALAVRSAANALGRRGYDHLAWMGSWLWIFPIAGAVFDIFEDLALLAIVNGNTGRTVPALATFFAVTKFAFLMGTGLYLIVALIALAQRRPTVSDA
ncbi:MAG: hypothetical protein ACRDKI_11400 [Solirubrobacterales bacterium]